MINIINQPSVKTGCGIAVYAMLMDVSYEEALIFARKNEVCKDNLFITIKQMKKGLSLILNKVILSKKVLSWNEHKNYVCFCKYENSSTKH